MDYFFLYFFTLEVDRSAGRNGKEATPLSSELELENMAAAYLEEPKIDTESDETDREDNSSESDETVRIILFFKQRNCWMLMSMPRVMSMLN